jgi:hypothetical protein
VYQLIGKSQTPLVRFVRDFAVIFSGEITDKTYQWSLTLMDLKSSTVYFYREGNRCIPAPYVDNATGVLDQSTRSVQVTCFPGHRFPNGRKSEVHYCNADGSWNTIQSCAGIFKSDEDLNLGSRALTSLQTIRILLLNFAIECGFDRNMSQLTAVNYIDIFSF